MLRYEVRIDGSMQEDLGFAFAELQQIRTAWILDHPSFRIEGVANELSLIELNKEHGTCDFRFGETERIHLEEETPLDLHWEAAERKHLYLRLRLHSYEAGDEYFRSGYKLRIIENVSIEGVGNNRNDKKEYDLPIRNGASLYLEVLKQYLFISGIFPSRNLVIVTYGPAPGVGKNYEVAEGKPTGFKYRNTGGAYENFYDEYQELTISLEEEVPDTEEEP